MISTIYLVPITGSPELLLAIRFSNIYFIVWCRSIKGSGPELVPPKVLSGSPAFLILL